MEEAESRTQTHIEGSLCDDTGGRWRLRAEEKGLRRMNPADVLILNFWPPEL